MSTVETMVRNTSTTSELLEKFIKNCQQRGLADETLRFYRQLLQSFVVLYPTLPTTPEPIEAWIGSYKSSQERRYAAFRAVRVFYNLIFPRFYPGLENPISKIAKPRLREKVKQPLSLEELKQLLDYPHHSSRTRAALYLMADTGCRVGEVVNLKLEDIQENTIKLRGKTGERVVPVSARARDKLIALKPEANGRLFPGAAHWLTELVSMAFKEAGVRGSAHLLRFTFASHWKGSDSTLKAIGGWKSWRMVEHYSQLRTEVSIEQHKQFSPLNQIFGNRAFQNSEKPVDNDAIQTIVKLAEEVGTLKERNRLLESYNKLEIRQN